MNIYKKTTKKNPKVFDFHNYTYSIPMICFNMNFLRSCAITMQTCVLIFHFDSVCTCAHITGGIGDAQRATVPILVVAVVVHWN